ncbi:MAG: SAM-dependent methyltransferase, partial [Thermomicrobiaceae bacterium]|nr:SAM-dependent methyltransferase [Thermomicrobiaceae bacterium]
PEEWDGAFDLVLEAYTLQALPEDVRRRAIERIARFPAPGGRLLVICRGREPEEEVTDFPRPLTRAELDRFRALGLTEESFEDLRDPENAAIRHFRVVYRR